ncbi:serine recombinase [Antrihabitans stalactiti]|uniref:serine recombinase n=1 Tax=Antrihabitans stalactiti TaxID=2584121 RepID=UPI0030B860D1
MAAATDRQRAVRDAVLRWLFVKSAEGHRGTFLDSDAIGTAFGCSLAPLTQDEVAEASDRLFRSGHVTGVPVMGLSIPRPILTVAGRRVAKAAHIACGRGRKPRSVETDDRLTAAYARARQ